VSEERNQLSDTQRKRDAIRRRNNRDSLRSIADLSDALYALWDEVDDYRERTDAKIKDGNSEMTGLVMELRDFRKASSEENIENSKLIREVLRGLNDLNQRVASGNFVANSVRSGRDIDGKTPSGNMPELSLGSVKAKAPPWLFGALFTLFIAAMAGVGVLWVVGYYGAFSGQPKATPGASTTK
jgi:hypothetical protein